MTFFLFAVCIVLGLLVILQKRQYVRLSRELQYVDERLRQIADADGRSPILVPSDHPGIRALSADLNRVLERWEKDRADYERARGSMKRMLTNISHDLRTPLTVLQGYGGFCRRQRDRKTERQSFLRLRKKSVRSQRHWRLL